MSQTYNNNNFPLGITLIEILVTTGILTVGILGILQAFPQGIDVSRDSELASTAQQLSQSKLEELNSLSYSDIAVGTQENKARITADTSSPLYAFQRTTIVSLVDQNFSSSVSDIGLKKVTVTIYWPSVFPFGTRSETVQAIISTR